MSRNSLLAISPIDGRYFGKTKQYREYFSEYALIRYRVRVEVEYFIALCELPLPQLSGVDKSVFDSLRAIYKEFSVEDAERIKEIEKTTNHDVKAVEYFLKEKFDALGLGEHKEFIHFGLTSQDINNTSIPLSMREALKDVYYPEMETVIATLREKAEEWAKSPSLLCQIRRSNRQLQRTSCGLPFLRLESIRQQVCQRSVGSLTRTMDHTDFQLRQPGCTI